MTRTLTSLAIDPTWLRAIPGRTITAIQLALLHGDLTTVDATLWRRASSAPWPNTPTAFPPRRLTTRWVVQRIAELREKAIPGTQTLGEFMQRRLSPAMATVAATAQRLASLSERVTRTSALLFKT